LFASNGHDLHRLDLAGRKVKLVGL
jgi:hypothetical protein